MKFNIEGLFREGEEKIAINHWYSFDYAVDILKGRFIAGEEEMKKYDLHWDRYISFLKSKGIEI